LKPISFKIINPQITEQALSDVHMNLRILLFEKLTEKEQRFVLEGCK